MFSNDMWSIVYINKAILDGVVDYDTIEWIYIMLTINQKSDHGRIPIGGLIKSR